MISGVESVTIQACGWNSGWIKGVYSHDVVHIILLMVVMARLFWRVGTAFNRVQKYHLFGSFHGGKRIWYVAPI